MHAGTIFTFLLFIDNLQPKIICIQQYFLQIIGTENHALYISSYIVYRAEQTSYVLYRHAYLKDQYHKCQL